MRVIVDTDIYNGTPAEDTYVGNAFAHKGGFGAYRTPWKGVGNGDVQRDEAGRILVFPTVEAVAEYLVPDAPVKPAPVREMCMASNGGVIHNAYVMGGVSYPSCRTMDQNQMGTWYNRVTPAADTVATCTKCIKRSARRAKR